MGYRSIVGVEIIGPKDKMDYVRDQLVNLEKDNSYENKFDGPAYGPLKPPNNDKYRYVFYSAWIKWYEEDVDVEKFYEIWDWASQEKEIEGRLIILGEDDNDNEMNVIGEGEFCHMGWERNISF